MAIARDNSGDIADGGSFTVGASSLGGTLVIACQYASTNTVVMTLGGVTMTQIPGSPLATGGGGYIYCAYLPNVSAGSKVFANSVGRNAAVVSYLNAPTTSPLDASAIATGLTGALTSTDANDWIAAFIQQEGGAASYSSGPAATTVVNAFDRFNDSNGTVAAGSQTQVWSGGSQQVNVLLAIKRAVAATAALRRTLMGAGT